MKMYIWSQTFTTQHLQRDHYLATMHLWGRPKGYCSWVKGFGDQRKLQAWIGNKEVPYRNDILTWIKSLQ